MLILINGLPGSGKSTIAKELVDHATIKHFEADMYFINKDGKYVYDISKIAVAHEWCQRMVDEALAGNLDVVVTNTSLKAWERKPYFDMARKYGTRVLVYTSEEEYKNIHNVPDAVFDRMVANKEPIADEELEGLEFTRVCSRSELLTTYYIYVIEKFNSLETVLAEKLPEPTAANKRHIVSRDSCIKQFLDSSRSETIDIEELSEGDFAEMKDLFEESGFIPQAVKRYKKINMDNEGENVLITQTYKR